MERRDPDRRSIITTDAQPHMRRRFEQGTTVGESSADTRIEPSDFDAAARRVLGQIAAGKTQLKAGTVPSYDYQFALREKDRGRNEAIIASNVAQIARDAATTLEAAEIDKNTAVVTLNSKELEGLPHCPVTLKISESSYLFNMPFQEAMAELHNAFMQHYFENLLDSNGLGTDDDYEKLGSETGIQGELLKIYHSTWLDARRRQQLFTPEYYHEPLLDLEFSPKTLTSTKAPWLNKFILIQFRDQYFEIALARANGSRSKAAKASRLTIDDFNRLENERHL